MLIKYRCNKLKDWCAEQKHGEHRFPLLYNAMLANGKTLAPMGHFPTDGKRTISRSGSYLFRELGNYLIIEHQLSVKSRQVRISSKSAVG
jgi:hypothetical protein